MIPIITRAAFVADTWLHRRLGRPYGIMLSVGLILDIFHRLLSVPKQLEDRHHLLSVALSVTMELALLIHQLAEMHERLGHHAKFAKAD